MLLQPGKHIYYCRLTKDFFTGAIRPKHVTATWRTYLLLPSDKGFLDCCRLSRTSGHRFLLRIDKIAYQSRRKGKRRRRSEREHHFH